MSQQTKTHQEGPTSVPPRASEIFVRVAERIIRLADLKETLDEILNLLKDITGCRHLAVRVIDANGNIPFYSHLGLDKDFLSADHWMTSKDCLCGHVARGDVDAASPNITGFGSFFTNSLSRFVADIENAPPKLKRLTFKNACLSRGYESVAIIPIKLQGLITAEMYLSDERKDLFPKETIEMLEKLGVQVGVAIQNARLFTSLRESQKKLEDLFNSAAVGILELDTKGTILQINDRGAHLLGYSSPHALHNNEIKIDELNLEQEEWEGFLESIDSDARPRTKTLSFRIGREKMYLEFSLAAVIDDRDNITGYRGTFRDMTDSIRLEEERLSKALTEALKNRYYQEILILKDEIKTEYPFDEMIGQSRALQKVKRAIQQAAPTETTVLIKGETGTGKELVARYIHEMSGRKDRILVKVNCAALSEGLIASELFGHEKGAFTGAIQKRVGRFEYADKATIFLDEIGDLPLETQAMLLRVLQDGEFERVGSSKTIRVDVRVLAATNRDLNLLVKERKFRQDLYFRLNVFPIEIPPLRERKEDIPLLAAYFLEVYGRKVGRKIDRVSEETLQHFLEYSWPGNVRELQNIIEHGLIVTKGEVLDVPRAYFVKDIEVGEKTGLLPLEEYERRYIQQILQRTRGVVYGDQGAAKILGLKPSTLQSRMKKLGIERK